MARVVMAHDGGGVQCDGRLWIQSPGIGEPRDRRTDDMISQPGAGRAIILRPALCVYGAGAHTSVEGGMGTIEGERARYVVLGTPSEVHDLFWATFAGDFLLSGGVPANLRTHTEHPEPLRLQAADGAQVGVLAWAPLPGGRTALDVSWVAGSAGWEADVKPMVERFVGRLRELGLIEESAPEGEPAQPMKSEIIEKRRRGVRENWQRGMTQEKSAEALMVSVKTVQRDEKALGLTRRKQQDIMS